MKNEISTYQQSAIDFLAKLGIKYHAKYLTYGNHFDDDKTSRHIFLLTLKRNGKQISFRFGQSIAAGSEEPTPYDLLASLTKYDPYSFEDFCSSYGYDTDSRKAEKVYHAVEKEWDKVNKFFTGEELEELQEIN